jgi:hypothetical protein
MKKITLLLSALICSYTFSQSIATYNIKFTNYWNATDHNGGNALPDNAHWSDFAIVNHNSNITFVKLGGTATAGVEDIAERGVVNNFRDNDVQDAIDANNAEQFINGGDLFLRDGSEIDIDGIQISEDYPLLTMLSMIAPSPDWMMAVNGIPLRNGGNWETLITMDIFPYDAGTEEGSAYELNNAATVPQGKITKISGVAPFNMERVGQLRIELVNVLSTNNVNPIDNLKIYPNPTKGNISLSNIQNINLKQIEIYSILGSLVKQIPVQQNLSILDLDISGLNTGMYLFKVSDKNGSSNTQKLLVE